MRTFLLALCLLLTSISFSQKIRIENNKFYVKDSLVYKHNIKDVLASNSEAMNLYKKAKNRQTLGTILLASGISMCVADGVMGLTTENRDYPQALTYVGIGVVGVSIPILSGNKKRVAKSIDLYNESQPEDKGPLGFNYDVKLINNRNGIGFNITF